MSLRKKTIDELWDLEVELRLALKEEKESYYRIISVYEELHRKITKERESEYKSNLPMIKKNLIRYLIRYGTYIKTQYRKDDRMATDSLRKALRYDKDNPAAHYRLGFLTYKEKVYTAAISHFQAALSHHKKGSHPDEYLLTHQQLYNAQLYLANSALYIAEHAQEQLQSLESEVELANVPKLQRSSLYEIIQKNERYLEENAFSIVERDGERRCAKETCEEILDDVPMDMLILYFSDRANILVYNKSEIELNEDQAEMLRYFLLKTSEQSLARKHHFAGIISGDKETGEIKNNTYTRRVLRLMEKMQRGGVPAESFIKGHSLDRQPAYYYTHTIPYMVMHRSDSTFILD